MRFSVLALLGFAAAATAGPVYKRDFNALANAVADVGDHVWDMRGALQNFSKNPITIFVRATSAEMEAAERDDGATDPENAMTGHPLQGLGPWHLARQGCL